MYETPKSIKNEQRSGNTCMAVAGDHGMGACYSSVAQVSTCVILVHCESFCALYYKVLGDKDDVTPMITSLVLRMHRTLDTYLL